MTEQEYQLAAVDQPPAAHATMKRQRQGWYWYHWANAPFVCSVVTVFLGPYLTAITRAAADAYGFVYPLGLKVAAASFFPYVISLSVFLQVLSLPILGAIADYSHYRKQLLAFFAYLGAFATMGLFFLKGSDYLLGGLLLLLANLSFGASIVFYNAFLPDVARPDERDHVSSVGWALGYIAAGLVLAGNLLLFARAKEFGLSTGQAVRINLLIAGIWWALFTLLPMALLKSRQQARKLPPGEHYLSIGVKQLKESLRHVRGFSQTPRFLLAYLLYSDGIQTVITLASVFGQQELKLSIATLTQVILMVQFIAFFGAIGFKYLARLTGARQAIMISLVIWMAVLVYAYAWLKTGPQFFGLAAAIAVVLGGSQALSRSVFSLMIPKGREAEYFSIYEISEGGTSWFGPLLFGLALQFTGSYRVAILSLIILFAGGLAVLARVNVAQAAHEAGNA